MAVMSLAVHPPLAPMLARLVRELPIGDYVYEPKWDGFRAICFRDGDDIEIQSRHGRPMARTSSQSSSTRCGRSQLGRSSWTARSSSYATATSTFPPSCCARIDWIPIRPVVVEVAYDIVDGQRFRHPAQFRRWRPDREPSSCMLDQLIESTMDPGELFPEAIRSGA